MKYDYLFKIVLAGDSNTGKTHFFNLLSDKNIDYLSHYTTYCSIVKFFVN